MENLTLVASLYGSAAASSLLVGAAIGTYVNPPQKLTASIMAFGAGILLSALSFELVEEATARAGFFPMASGALIGGLLFALLNKVLNKKGGYARKRATIKNFIRDKKSEEAKTIVNRLANIAFFRKLPPEEIDEIVPKLETMDAATGQIIFKEGEEADGLYVIEKGEVEIIKSAKTIQPGKHSSNHNGHHHVIATLSDGDAFGEMAMLVDDKRSATVRVTKDSILWKLKKKFFLELASKSPSLSMEISKLLAERLHTTSRKHAEAEREKKKWKALALKSIMEEAEPKTNITSRVATAIGGAPVAIWLGILLDGIPESAVIGASITPEKMVGIALMAGIFLSNIPEALSSAIGMKQQGHSRIKIMAMWGSLVLLSGLWSAAGNLLCASSSSSFIIAFVQGMGAGAMLTVVAETMLPEAFEQGGSIVGITTLTGFLSAYFFRWIQG